MTPFFSIITVHFNQLEALKVTMDKVHAQTGMGTIFEHLVIDGGSADGTMEYLDAFPAHPAFRFISEKDDGIYDAMNKGIQMSKGEYLIFINAGDYLDSDHVLRDIRLRMAQCDILYGNTLVNYEEHSRIAKAKPMDEFWKSLPFIHQSVIVKKSLLLGQPFDTSYRYCADYHQLASLFSKGIKFQFSGTTIGVIRAGGASDQMRVRATREVFTISNQLFHLNISQRLFFRMQLVKARGVLWLKKMIPAAWTRKLTRYKYNLR